MDPGSVKMKPCCVVLEQLTPKKQLALSAELRNVINERNMLTTRTKQKVLRDLESISESESEEKMKLKCKTVQEILNTEVSYLKQLEIIINFFMNPIQHQNLLNKEDFNIIFGTIKTLYRVNGELLSELKQDITNISKAFGSMAPCFKLYSTYAYNFKASLNILQNAQNEKGPFIKYVQQQESRPEVQSKLSALLIAPIQRIPRYRMLLKQMLDYTSPTESDYAALKAAVRKIEEVANHIDHLVEEQENTQRMIDLQTRLVNQQPALIKPGRKIIKEDVLYKMSTTSHNYNKKYFVLMSDIILYCKIKGSGPKAPGSLKCAAILPLNKCTVTEDPISGFKIVCENEELMLYHERASEGKEWAAALKDTITKHLKSRLTLRKESSTRRPVKRKHLDEYEEVGISPGQPRKKRGIKEQIEHEHNIPTTTPVKSENGIADTGRFRPSHRRPLHGYSYQEMYPDVFKNGHESHLSSARSSVTPSRSYDGKNGMTGAANNDNELQVAKNVFVFGANKSSGFSFKMGNIFRGIGSSMKNMFGFK